MAEERTYPQAYQGQSEPGEQPGGAAVPATYGTEAGTAVARTGEQMASFIGRFAEVARAEAAVGPAQTVQGHTMVPLAAVSAQAGFGLGFGGGGGTDEKSNQGSGSGGGGGGGGRGSSRVIAVVDISETGVEVKPVPDVTTLAVGAMALAGLMLLTRRRAGDGAVRSRLLGMLKRE